MSERMLDIKCKNNYNIVDEYNPCYEPCEININNYVIDVYMLLL